LNRYFFGFLVASLALTKQSKTQKFKEKAFAGKLKAHAGARSHACRRAFFTL
jgi:hypothetical protein